MSGRVIVRRDPGGHRERAYWHAECRACVDAEVDCYPLPSMTAEEQSSCEAFAPVLAWAVNHGQNCPVILAERLPELTGHRWCRACGRITSPDDDCCCGWWA